MRRIFWCLIAGVAMVAMLAKFAVAQPEEGRRGRGGPGGPGGPGRGGPPTALRLVAESKDVQDALKLTDEQRKQISDIHDGLREENEELRDKMRDELGNGRVDFREMQGQMEKILGEASAEMTEVIDDGQQTKLAGITVQVSDAGALGDPVVAAELKLSDDQKSKLGEIRDAQRTAMREMFRGGRDGERPTREDFEAMREKMEEGRAAANKEALAVLTDEQKSQFESLKGTDVGVDVSRLRGMGGRGGFEGRRDDRERGDRERGERGRGDRGKRGRDRDRDRESDEETQKEDASESA